MSLNLNRVGDVKLQGGEWKNWSRSRSSWQHRRICRIFCRPRCQSCLKARISKSWMRVAVSLVEFSLPADGFEPRYTGEFAIEAAHHTFYPPALDHHVARRGHKQLERLHGETHRLIRGARRPA